MSELPNPIETHFETNEGFTYRRTETDILFDLVAGFNELVRYLESKEEGTDHAK
jgi:hypothetical protein